MSTATDGIDHSVTSSKHDKKRGRPVHQRTSAGGGRQWSDAVAPEVGSHRDVPVGLARALRQLLVQREFHSGALPKFLHVTSTVSGEGVTTASQALAAVLAHDHRSRACWVDCSWLADKPDTTSPGPPGLYEVMARGVDLDAVVRTSPEAPGVAHLAAGAVPALDRDATVRSAEFLDAVERLGERFDYVVFDVPPVLASTSTLAVLRNADAILFVVRHRSTHIRHVQSALNEIGPVPILGVLLNGFRLRIPRRLRAFLES